MLGRGVVIAVVLAASAAVAAPSAQAATPRYAAPAAQGAGDCGTPGNACPISTAVATAGSGDTIYVRADLGDYDLAGGGIAPGTSKALRFVGINGTPRLIANGSADTLILQAASSSAVNLYLENDGSGDGLAAGLVGTPGSISLDRLYVRTTGTPSHTCLIEGGVTLTDSVCWQSNSAAASEGILLEGTNTLRNDVSWVRGSGPGVDCGAFYFPCDGTVINTITRATGTGGSDVATSSSGMTATLTVRYSNFGTAVAHGTTANDHFNIDATNQHTSPQLVNPGAGNFRELPASPTINAGITNQANGAADLDGKPRTVNGKTDIGAYERGTPVTRSPDRFPPVETLFARKRQKLGKRVTVAVTCSEPCRAVATGKLRIAKPAKRYKLKKASKTAAAGKKVKLKLKLSAKARKAARRALKRHRNVTAKLTVVVRDAAGNKASKHGTVKLKRR